MIRSFPAVENFYRPARFASAISETFSVKSIPSSHRCQKHIHLWPIHSPQQRFRELLTHFNTISLVFILSPLMASSFLTSVGLLPNVASIKDIPINSSSAVKICLLGGTTWLTPVSISSSSFILYIYSGQNLTSS